MIRQCILSSLLLICCWAPLALSEVLPVFSNAKRVVFLGDSITNDGRYITVIEARMLQDGISPMPELLNLGLPSEGCTGLTEPGHPFPRPNVHERLQRVLDKAKPDVVVACYGMNDGIYHPFSEERFSAFQAGILDLIDSVERSGAKLILLTPPAFDPLPMGKKGRLAKLGAPKFAWTDIYEDYDGVMRGYADWIRSLYEPIEMVIDLHSPVNAHLAERRKNDPDYVMSPDGVHVDLAGQTLLAEAILESLGYASGASVVEPELYELVQKKQRLLHDAWLTHTGHVRPGMKDGLPLPRAYAEASKIDREVAAWFAGRHRGSDSFERIVDRIPSGEAPYRLFNGLNLGGWNGDEKYWKIENGMIRGANEGSVPSSTYLFTDKSHRDFRLLFEVKQTMSPDHSTMHSAIAALGEQIEDKGGSPYGFRGPLLMFCHDWGIWDAHRRNRVEPNGQRGPMQIPAEKKGEWNMVEFLVRGNRIRCAANGVEVFDFTDEPGMLRSSPIGLQLHSNNRPQEFLFRGLVLSEAPGDSLISVAQQE